MSHRTGMIATCEATGKRSYVNRKTAKRALERSALDYGEPRSVWNAYRCRDCRLFHIGHRTPNYDTVYRIEEGSLCRGFASTTGSRRTARSSRSRMAPTGCILPRFSGVHVNLLTGVYRNVTWFSLHLAR